ncbi:MAG: response regulator [Hyphomonadaceae bacterium]
MPRFYGEAETPQRVEQSDAPQGRGEIILAVEDDERVRSSSTEALRKLGYAVLVAPGGVEALRLVETGQHIDLLFTDVVMPEMNGRQLA